jgi:hypothetical protein
MSQRVGLSRVMLQNFIVTDFDFRAHLRDLPGVGLSKLVFRLCMILGSWTSM